MSRKNPVSVPRGRIDGRVAPLGRGEFAPLVEARSEAELDAGLTRVLRLPRPEKPPANVSKCDR